jgi:hypothetical protein
MVDILRSSQSLELSSDIRGRGRRMTIDDNSGFASQSARFS